MFTQILGLAAGALIVFASLPQILKIIKSKSTKDISLAMYIILNIGTLLWVIYGFVTNQIVIIIPNLIFLVLNLIILYLKIKHG